MGNIGSRQVRFDVLPTSPLREPAPTPADGAPAEPAHDAPPIERTPARAEPARS